MIQQTNRNLRTFILMFLLFSSMIQLFGQTHYTDDVKNGTETHWSENGNKQSEDHYVNGVREDTSKLWYDDGALNSEVSLLHGLREGMSRTYYRNGQLVSEKMMHNDVEDGHCTYWLESGQKDYEREYVKGEKDGVEIYWNNYGEKRIENHYTKGLKNGLTTVWHSGSRKQDYYKAREMHYVNDQLEGRVRYWFPNGQLHLIEEYKAGNQVGVVDEWLENGKQLKMACDTTYYDYYGMFMKSIIHYSNKIKNGECTLFDEHGKRKRAVNYVQGRKEGMQQIWYPNGVLSSEGNYKDGKRNGLFKTWDCKGELAFEVQFNRDKLGKVTYFNTSKGLDSLQYPTPPLTEFEEDDYSQMSKTIGGKVNAGDAYPNCLHPHYAILIAHQSGEHPAGYDFTHESGDMYSYKLVFIKTDTLVLIQSLEQLRKIFSPIQSESEAISYTKLVTGAYALDSIILPKNVEVYQKNVGPTYAKEEARGYRVLLFDTRTFNMHYTYEYLVTFSGKVTLINQKYFYTDDTTN